MFLGMELKTNISLINYFSIPLILTAVISIHAFTGAKTLLLLTEKDYFGVKESEIGRVTTNLAFYCAIPQLFFFLVVG